MTTVTDAAVAAVAAATASTDDFVSSTKIETKPSSSSELLYASMGKNEHQFNRIGVSVAGAGADQQDKYALHFCVDCGDAIRHFYDSGQSFNDAVKRDGNPDYCYKTLKSDVDRRLKEATEKLESDLKKWKKKKNATTDRVAERRKRLRDAAIPSRSDKKKKKKNTEESV